MKILGSTKSTTRPEKGIVGVGGDSRIRCDRSKLDRSKLDGSEIDDGKIDGGEIDDEIGKKSQKLSKSKKTLGSNFFTPGAKLAFTELRQAFVKVLILHHFDLECHIWVKTDTSSYAIGKVFS